MQKETKPNMAEAALKALVADKKSAPKQDQGALAGAQTLGPEPKSAAGLAGVDKNITPQVETVLKPQLQQMVESLGMSKSDFFEALKSSAAGLAQGTFAGLKSKPDAAMRTVGMGGEASKKATSTSSTPSARPWLGAP